ncbi:hypothetical protein O181_057828 [Austropuccinia psidii MF-1]|uniref:Uncharacterized protein n=1 Tax=Austropuccinia psidii MF-1 TaxID=1389203 RepID=A0A9Q3EFQ3_9BASI|nr:hypothetical protein [Austropuccinia psidii MF-1]
MDSDGANDNIRRHTPAPSSINLSNQCKHTLTSNDSDGNSDHMNKNLGIKKGICASQTQEALKRKGVKITCPSYCRISDQLVAKPKNLALRIVEHKMDIQDGQLIEQMRSNVQYNYDHDDNLSKMKQMELKVMNAIEILELEHKHEIVQEKLKEDIIVLDSQRDLQQGQLNIDIRKEKHLEEIQLM